MNRLLVNTFHESGSICNAALAHLPNNTDTIPHLILTSPKTLKFYKLEGQSLEESAIFHFFEIVETSLLVQLPTSLKLLVVLIFADSSCVLYEYSNNKLVEKASVSLYASVKATFSQSPVRKVEGPSCSPAILKDDSIVFLIGFYNDFVHFVHLTLSTEKFNVVIADLKRAPLLGIRPVISELELVQRSTTIVSLEFLPNEYPGQWSYDKALLVLLHRHEDPRQRAVHLECLELDASKPSPEHWASGPWSCRNMHPSTNIIRAFKGNPSANLLPGILAVSSLAVTLVSDPGAPALRFMATDPSAPKKQELVLLNLLGLPTCMTELRPGVYTVGDSCAGLHLINLAGAAPWAMAIDIMGPRMSAPSVLLPVPLSGPSPPEEGGDCAGLECGVFVGSTSADSQLLGVPLGSNGLQRPSELQWPMLDGSLIKNLGPVHDAVVVEDLTGSSEPFIFAACGVAPRGRLCRAHLAAALQPYSVEGPEMPGSIRLFPLSAQPGSSQTSHLALSFEGACRTDLLDMSSDTLTQVSCQGLDEQHASLLVAALPQGGLIQVTPASVRLLGPPPQGAHIAMWSGPGPITLAASHGANVVLACQRQLIYMRIMPNASDLKPEVVVDLTQQASALALCCMSAKEAEQQLPCLVLGTWMDNKLEIRRLADQAVLSEVSLGSETPRSAVTLHHVGRSALLVGTNSGAVILWEVHMSPADGRIRLEAGRLVRVGTVSVELTVVQEKGLVFAHSSSAAVITPISTLSPSTSLPVTDLLSVSRIHGSERSRALCFIDTRCMPASLAWISFRGQLLFGSLDLQPSLQWLAVETNCVLSMLTWHAASSCLLALCEELDGSQSLRLVHGASMRVVAEMRLRRGHSCTALKALQLPCSSSGDASSPATGQYTRPSTSSKEFIVMASYITLEAPGDGGSGIERENSGNAMKTQGLLSVLEVKMQPSTKEKETIYTLVLHGTIPVSSFISCLDICTPEPSDLDKARATGTAGPRNAGTAARAGVSSGRTGLPSVRNGAAAGTPSVDAAARVVDASRPYLLAGGHDGVLVFDVHIDDAGTDGEKAVQTALTALETPPPPLPRSAALILVQKSEDTALQKLASREARQAAKAKGAREGEVLSNNVEGDVEMSSREGSPERHRMEDDLEAGMSRSEDSSDDQDRMDVEPFGSRDVSSSREASDDEDVYDEADLTLEALAANFSRDWNQRVVATLVARGETYSSACVCKVSVSGSSVMATDFLSSVTAFRLLSCASGITLLPVGVDKHCWFAPTVHHLTPTQALLAIHPYGLALLERDPASEDLHLKTHMSRAADRFESGAATQSQAAAAANRQETGDGRQSRQTNALQGLETLNVGDIQQLIPNKVSQQALGMSASDACDLSVTACCRPGHSVYTICPGRVGLQVCRWPEHSRQESSGQQEAGVLCFASDGSVALVELVQGQRADALARCQTVLESLPATDAALVTGVLGSHRHTESWSLLVPSLSAAEGSSSPSLVDSAPVGNGVDGQLVSMIVHSPQAVKQEISKYLDAGVIDSATICLARRDVCLS